MDTAHRAAGSPRTPSFPPIEEPPIATELYKDSRGQFRWRLKASNGKIIADIGEGYVRRIDCEHGIELVKSQEAAAVVKQISVAEVAEKS